MKLTVKKPHCDLRQAKRVLKMLYRFTKASIVLRLITFSVFYPPCNFISHVAFVFWQFIVTIIANTKFDYTNRGRRVNKPDGEETCELDDIQELIYLQNKHLLYFLQLIQLSGVLWADL